MLDTAARRALAPTLDAIAGVLARAGVPPLAATGLGWLAGVGACVSAGFGLWTLTLALWLVNRLLDGLDGPLARRTGASELGGFLDIVADFSVYAGFVLGVAVARPEARLACLALLCAYYVSGTAFLALSSLLERRGSGADDIGLPRGGDGRALRFSDTRSLRFVGGLAEGTETVIVYCLFCLLPSHAEVIAWTFTAAVAITAGQRLVLGGQLLRHPAPAPLENR